MMRGDEASLFECAVDEPGSRAAQLVLVGGGGGGGVYSAGGVELEI